MNKKQRILIILGIILITGAIGAVLGYYYADSLRSPVFKGNYDRGFNGDYNGDFNRTPPKDFRDEIEKARENFEIYVSIKSAVTLINIVIAVILIGMYVKIYREVKSDFTIGLIVVMFALLFYAITSNPYIQWLFSYRGFGLGPFILLPDIFTTIALSVLLYLSLK
jgi:hypothetical protein